MRSRMLVVAAGLAAFATPAPRKLYIVQDSGRNALHRRAAADHPDERHRRGRQGLHVADGSGGCLEDVKVCESGGTVGGPAVAPAVPAPR